MAEPHGASLAARSPGSWLPTVSFSQSRKPDLDRIRQQVGQAPNGPAGVSLHSVPRDLDFPSSPVGSGSQKMNRERAAGRDWRCAPGLCAPQAALHVATQLGRVGSHRGPHTLPQSLPARQPLLGPQTLPKIAPCPPTGPATLEAEGGGRTPPAHARGHGIRERWGTQAGISASLGRGVFSLGRGLAGGGRELEPVCRLTGWNRWLGGERVRGGEGRRLRGPGAEELGFDAPSLPGEKRPLPTSSQKEGAGKMPPLSSP